MVVYVVVAILLVMLAGLSMSVRIVKQYEREPLPGRLGVPGALEFRADERTPP